MPYEYYGPDNRLVVCTKYDKPTEEKPLSFYLDQMGKNNSPPQKGDWVVYPSMDKKGYIAYIDRDGDSVRVEWSDGDFDDFFCSDFTDNYDHIGSRRRRWNMG